MRAERKFAIFQLEDLSSILGESCVYFDFPLIRVAVEKETHLNLERGRVWIDIVRTEHLQVKCGFKTPQNGALAEGGWP